MYKKLRQSLILSSAVFALGCAGASAAEPLTDTERLFNQDLKKSHTSYKDFKLSASSIAAALQTPTDHQASPKDLARITPAAADGDDMGMSGSESELDVSAEADSFVFGDGGSEPIEADPDDSSSRFASSSAGRSDNLDFGGQLGVRVAYLLDHNASARVTTRTFLKPELSLRVGENWDIKTSVNLDRFTEHGDTDFVKTTARYDENYVRYGDEDFRITVGAQKAIWGRVDDAKPTDQLGSQDFRTFLLEDYEDRRQAIPAVRGEYYSGDYKLDGIFAFDLRPTELAERDSVWSFIDTDAGRTVLTLDDAALASVIQNATFAEDDGGIGGGGLRLSKTGEVFDYAVTAQRLRQTIPFYEINSALLDAVEGGTPLPVALATVPGATITTRHPWTWLVGGDFAVPLEDMIFRFEGAWMNNFPVYTTSLRRSGANSFQAVAGIEFYPGDGDLRVIMQGSAQILHGAENILGRQEIYGMNGSLEQEFAQARWVANFDYFMGFDNYDLFLHPKLTYQGFDSHKFYLEGYYFDGNQVTTGGFFSDNSLVMAGWDYEF
ncbi:MAG: hypothetical protein H6863_05300 [Rhodospirillales bacterium]|nr:hypothetical protein [Rhodospirillales bacterium]